MFKKLLLCVGLVLGVAPTLKAAAEPEITQEQFEHAQKLIRGSLLSRLDASAYCEHTRYASDAACEGCKIREFIQVGKRFWCSYDYLQRLSTSTFSFQKEEYLRILSVVRTVLDGSCPYLQSPADMQWIAKAYAELPKPGECVHASSLKACDDANCFAGKIVQRKKALQKFVCSFHTQEVLDATEQALLVAMQNETDPFVKKPERLVQINDLFEKLNEKYKEFGDAISENETLIVNILALTNVQAYERAVWLQGLGKDIEIPATVSQADHQAVDAILQHGDIDVVHDERIAQALRGVAICVKNGIECQKLVKALPCIENGENDDCCSNDACPKHAVFLRHKVLQKAVDRKKQLSADEQQLVAAISAGTDAALKRAREYGTYAACKQQLFDGVGLGAQCIHKCAPSACQEQPCFQKNVLQRIALLEKKMDILLGKSTEQITSEEDDMLKSMMPLGQELARLGEKQKACDEKKQKALKRAQEQRQYRYFVNELGFTDANFCDPTRAEECKQELLAPLTAEEQRFVDNVLGVSQPAISQVQSSSATSQPDDAACGSATQSTLQNTQQLQTPQPQGTNASTPSSAPASTQANSGLQSGITPTPTPSSGKPADATSGKPADASGKPSEQGGSGPSGNPATQKSEGTNFGRLALRAGYCGGSLLFGKLLYDEYTRAHKTIRMRNAQLSDNECAAQARAQLWTRLKKNKGLLALGALSTVAAAADIYCAATAA